jgi:hypothetical protein
VGSCDHCSCNEETTAESPDEVVTALTLQRGEMIVFLARFCQRHFLLFSDAISDQVAALLYPSPKPR